RIRLANRSTTNFGLPSGPAARGRVSVGNSLRDSLTAVSNDMGAVGRMATSAARGGSDVNPTWISRPVRLNTTCLPDVSPVAGPKAFSRLMRVLPIPPDNAGSPTNGGGTGVAVGSSARAVAVAATPAVACAVAVAAAATPAVACAVAVAAAAAIV